MPVHGTPDGGGPSGDRSQPSRGGGSGIRARLEGMTSDEQSTTGPSEETKRKFREALERKQAHARSGASHENGGGKNQHAHGPAANKRTFRRKSG